MDRSTAKKVTRALYNLARANRYDFSRSPVLCQRYWQRLKAKAFTYTADKVTCGRLDCWSTYKDLEARYPWPESILADCEDIACAYSGWLASQCLSGVYVGLVPGRRVAHAISGVEREGKIVVVDACRWYGMGPTHYDGIVWEKLQ